jgi:hypothetical protein
MTNTWSGKPVCGPRNKTSNLRNRKQFQAIYLDLELRFQSARMLYLFIYSVAMYGGEERCLEAFGGET